MFPIIPSFPEPISLHNRIQIRIQRARRRVAALFYSKHQPIHRNPQLSAQPRHSLQRGYLLRPFDVADEGTCHADALGKVCLSPIHIYSFLTYPQTQIPVVHIADLLHIIIPLYRVIVILFTIY